MESKYNKTHSIHNEHLSINIMVILGLREEPIAAHYQIIQGLEPKVVKQLADILGVKINKIYNMVGISSTEISRLNRNGYSHLSCAQSVKIYMFAKVIANGLALFDGEPHLLLSWLAQPARALAGYKPEDLLSTDVGAQALIEFISQLKYGVYV